MGTNEADVNTVQRVFNQYNVCVVVPTYNNEGTIQDVLNRMLAYTDRIIVIDDGSTDSTSRLLAPYHRRIVAINRHVRNRGKGKALCTAFGIARAAHYRYLLTIDADGQHYPEDLPRFADALEQHPDAVIIGSRNLQQPNMPGKSSFANRFSNFWFHLQTGQRLPDTQTGYRLYPLQHFPEKLLFPARYEAELLLLVQAAWRGVKLLPIYIRVYYPPREERVSHFRPVADFARISLLNTFLCIGAVCYGFPLQLIRFFKNRPA
ncbi:MAG: glycosyltransferase family 2 protein [Prevotellaceae bacterium]|jgi:glycosyltransferase involved in cell wall biosynthesis|nr:glycosyltransferase family 2 protein [Prevotellaceae bacterium]